MRDQFRLQTKYKNSLVPICRSCIESSSWAVANVMGARWATVHGVTESDRTERLHFMRLVGDGREETRRRERRGEVREEGPGGRPSRG